MFSILEEIFRNVLIMSAAGGVLSLILLAVKPLTKKRFSSGWRYYIWLSVLLVMTVPVSFLSQTLIPALQSGQESGAASGSRTVQIQALESSLAGFSASADVGMTGDMAADAAGGTGRSGEPDASGISGDSASGSFVQFMQPVSSPEGTSPETDGEHNAEGISPETGGKYDAEGALTEAGGEPEWRPLRYLALHVSLPQGLMTAAGLIWLTVALALLTMRIARYRMFARMIRRHSRRSSIGAAETGIRHLRIRETDLLEAPVMVGFFRPVLYLQEAEFDEEDLRYILAHELTHYRRRDLLYKWFAMVVKSIHWFNPLIYIVSKQIDTECEVSCDVAVTEKMSEQEKNDYMRMILSLMERSRGCPRPLTTQMAGTKKMLIRRFDAIRSGKTTGKIMSAVSVAAAFALFTTTAFAGSVLSEITDSTCTVVVRDAQRQVIEYTDPPFVQSGKVYLPLRETFEKLGYTEENSYIEWDDGTIDIAILAYPMNNFLGRMRLGDPVLSCDVSRDTSLEGIGGRIDEEMDQQSGGIAFKDHPAPVLKDSTVYVPSDMLDYIVYGFFGRTHENGSFYEFDCRVYDPDGREVQMEEPDTTWVVWTNDKTKEISAEERPGFLWTGYPDRDIGEEDVAEMLKQGYRLVLSDISSPLPAVSE